jgi:DNA-binding MarR family transcriptional regulator
MLSAMAKSSKPAEPAELLAVGTEAQAPLDSALDDLIGYALRRAQLKLFQNLIGRLAAHDLRPAQFSALAIIDQNPGLMQADLAKALAIEPPQVVPLLNKLESRALAVRVRCKPDKRSYGIFLSKTGETLLKELKQIAAQSDLDSTAALSGGEREELLRLLKKVYQQ